MKRFLALFLCIMMVLSLAPAAAFATEDASAEEIVEAMEPAPAEVPAKEEKVFNVEEAYQTYIALSAEEQEVFLANLTEEQRGELMAYIAALAPAEEPAAEEPSKESEEPAVEEPAAEPEAEEFEFSEITANLADANVCQIGETGYATVAAAFTAAASGNTIVMTADSTETATATLLANTDTEKTVTLDLNGHTIQAGNDSKRLIYVYSGNYLTIQDSAGGGKLYGNEKSGVQIAQGIYVDERGTVELKSGTIDGCNTYATSKNAAFGGAVYVKGRFIMSGGTISNCAVYSSTDKNAYGGAVCVKSGSFEMSGGTISECKAKKVTDGKAAYGGGVDLYGGNFTMSGGTITGCTAPSSNYGGSVYISNADSTFEMNGGTIASSSVVAAKGTLTINGGVLVCTISGDGTKTATGGWFTSAGIEAVTAGTGKYKTTDCDDAPNASAQYTVVSSEKYSITFEGGTVTGDNPKETAHGTKTALPAATPTGDNVGKNFKGWTLDEAGEGTLFTEGTEVEFAADTTTFYAQWASEPVAKIGETSYYSFASAVDAALEAGTATIQLVKDEVETDSLTTIAAGKVITIDLNGKTLSNVSETRTFYVNDTGKLIIDDTSGDKNGIVNTSETYKNQYGSGIYIQDGGTLEIKAGTINCRNAESTSDIYVQRKKSTTGSLNISGGTIIGIIAKSENAVVTITGGWFSNAVNSSFVVENYVATGACVYGAPSGAPYTVKSTESEVTYTVTYDVDGGTAKDPTVVPEYEAFDVPEAEKTGSVFGYWTVGEDTATKYKLGDKVWFNGDVALKANWVEEAARVITATEEIPCGSFNDAVVKALGKGTATIKLTKNVEIDSLTTIAAGKVITLDLNGKTLTNTGADGTFSVAATGKLIITDSTEDKAGVINTSSTCTSAGAGVYVEMGGELEIDGGKLNCRNASAKSVIFANGKEKEDCGKVTIKSGTIIGNIARTSKSNVKISISGGWFSAGLNSDYVAAGYVAAGPYVAGAQEGTPYKVVSSAATESHNVTFDTDGGTEIQSRSVKVCESSELPEPEKEGYAFDYWIVSGTTEPFYAAGDKIWTNGDVTFEAVWTDVCAQVTTGTGTEQKTKNYMSFDAAFAAAVTNEAASIKLLDGAEITESKVIPEGKDITLDLNGETLTSSIASKVFSIKGSLTVKDESGTAGGTIKYTNTTSTSNGRILYVEDVAKAQLRILSGNIMSENAKETGTDIYKYYKNNDSGEVVCIEITGGIISAKVARINNIPKASIKGGWFRDEINSKWVEENLSVVKVEETEKAATPYTVSATKYTLSYNAGAGEATSAPAPQTMSALDGYTVYHKMRVATPFKRTDGEHFYKFDHWNTLADDKGISYKSGAQISLSGDTVLYAQYAITEDMCAEIVRGEDPENYPQYPTVGEAVFDAEKGETVQLLGDVTETILVPEGADVVLDLKGHKIEGAGTGSAITNNGTLKIVDSSDDKTGSISGTAQSYGGGIESNGKLTLESGTITGEAPTGGGGIYVKNGSTFVMNGGTVTGTSAKGSAIYINNSGNDVTINGGKINGSIYKGESADITIKCSTDEVLAAVFSDAAQSSVAELLPCRDTISDTSGVEGYPWTVRNHNGETIEAVLESNNGYSIDNGIQVVRKDSKGNLKSTGKITFKYSGGETIPSKDISLTLTGVDVDLSTGDVTPAAAKTGSYKIVVKLAKDPVKKAKAVSLSGKIIPVQVKEYSWTLKDGDTALQDKNIEIDAAAVESAAKTFTVKPKDIKDETGASITLDEVKFAYSTNDAKVAAVNSKLTSSNTITIPKGAKGQAFVAMKVTTNASAVDSAVLITVKDYAPRLPFSAITFDTQKNDEYAIPVVTSYGNTITGVEFGKVDKAGTFTPSEDFETKLNSPSCIMLSTDKVQKNGTTAGTLRITTKLSEEAEPVTYDYAFKITVKNSAPSVTAKVTQKFNKFYAVPKAKVSFSVKGCKVNDVEIEENDLFGGYWDANEFVVTRKDGQTATTGTITLFVSLDGYAFPVTKTVKLTDETKAPVLVLDHASSTLNKTIGTTDTFTVSVKGSDEEVVITEVTTTAKATVASVEKDTEADNGFKVTINDSKGGSVPVAIAAEGWADGKTVTVKPTVKVTDKAPSTKVDAAKLTLNKAFEQSAVVQVSLDQTDVISVAVDDKSGKLADKLVPVVDDSTVTFSTVAGAEGTPKGTYKFDIIAQYKVGEETYGAQKQTVTVTVTEVVPKVTVSKVTFNTNYLEFGESAKLTEKVGTKGYDLTGLAVADTELGYSIYSDNSGFYLLGSEDAKTDIKSIALKATLEDFDGNTAEVDTSVPVAFTSKAPALTIKSTGKLDMITRDPKFLWDETGVFYTITKISNVNAMVDKAELQGEDADLLVLDYTGSSYRVTLKDEAEVAAKDKLNFSLKITLADTCTCSKVLTDYTFKTVQTVNESKLKVKTEGVTTALYQSADKYELEYIINPSSPAAAKIEKVELNTDKIDARLRSVITLNTSEYGKHSEGMDCEFEISECYFAAGKTYTIPVKVYAKGAVTPTLVDLKFTVAK